MLNKFREKEIASIIENALNEAEEHWRNAGSELMIKSVVAIEDARAEAEPSKIPGHAIVQSEKTVVDEFIAFVADMRDSSKHLLCAISQNTAKVSMLQRVYFETSALLPAIAQTIKYENGSVTEYLGDGVLGLFQVDKNDKNATLYAAYRAAENTINCTRSLVNKELNKRYSLPEIDIGVGLALSKALVTLVGLEGEKHPKAVGECVYRATKLSGGDNKVYIDEALEAAWPQSRGGVMRFRETKIKGVKGFCAIS